MPAFRHSERVAIIGGGCTGTTCFWALQNTAHDVHLFEASSTLGGRIREFSFEHNGNWTSVNTETPSFNAEVSPNLVSLLRCLGIPTSAIPFTFTTSVGTRTFEWCSSVVKAILRQPRVLCHVETYRTLVDILWFKYFVGDSLSQPHGFGAVHETKKDLSTGEYLAREKYSNVFAEGYLAALLSVLWRTNALKYLPQFPIQALIQCLRDHQFFHSPHILSDWCRINKGASQLIQVMAKASTQTNIHLRTRVRDIQRIDKREYRLLTSDGREMVFDRVVFAIDGQGILNLLDPDVESEEEAILQGLRAGTNIAVLHSDHYRVPDVDHSWPSSNYISFANITDKQDDRNLASKPCNSSLTYNVNTLQDIPACLFGRIFITVNPITPPRPPLVQGVWEFTDPDPNPVTLNAQSRLPSIQNQRGLSYGFRWTGRGFLEDSVSAGLEIASEHFGAHLPFEFIYHGDPMRSKESRSNLRQRLIRIIISILYAYVQVFQICWLLLGGFWGRLRKSNARRPAGMTLNRVQQFQTS